MELILVQRAIGMAMREFSKNPAKALRSATDQPVMVTKYGHPVAFLISAEYWNELIADIREKSLEEMAAEHAVPQWECEPGERAY